MSYEFSIGKEKITPLEVAIFYLGPPNKISGDSFYYYSPFRQKERTPSFVVNDEKGFHDFGTSEHFNINYFVSKLLNISIDETYSQLFKDFYKIKKGGI